VFPWKPFEDSSTLHIHFLRQSPAPPLIYSRQPYDMPARFLSCFSIRARPRKQRFGVRIRAREICFCSRLQKSRPALQPNQPPIQWMPQFFREISGRSKKLIPQFYLVLRLRMSGDFPLLLTPWTGTILHSGSIGAERKFLEH